MSASAASKKQKHLLGIEDKWLPNIDEATNRYFSDLLGFTDEATKLADTVAESDLNRAMRLREKALPGITKTTQGALDAIAPLLKGELPPAVLEAYARAGGASTVGSGFGGSQFGFLNTGLFGARGALGAMQQGFGLLPALMSTLPNVNSPSTAAFLESIMTPAQRVQTQLQVRGQNIQSKIALTGLPSSGEVWGSGMQQVGGAMLGGAVSGGGGAGGGGLFGSAGGGGGTPNTITGANYITPL
jgi:hypothetical protein